MERYVPRPQPVREALRSLTLRSELLDIPSTKQQLHHNHNHPRISISFLQSNDLHRKTPALTNPKLKESHPLQPIKMASPSL
jgi:hypothetical protein